MTKRLFSLSFDQDGTFATHRLAEGETLIGRESGCDLVLNLPAISRKHARIRVSEGRVYLRDNGSTHGTRVNGVRIVAETELAPCDTFQVGDIQLTLLRAGQESEVLSDSHQFVDLAATIEWPIDARAEAVAPPRDDAGAPTGLVPEVGERARDRPVQTPEVSAGNQPARSGAAAATRGPSGADSTPGASPPTRFVRPVGERRRGEDRRRTNLGRAEGDRRTGRDRREGRILRLLSDISKTLVTIQPIGQVLERVVDLVFDVLPAERGFLLLRDSWEMPLTARVIRNRDGSVPSNVSLSRTVVSRVMRDRVAILAHDARYDPRLDDSNTIHSMNVRSFMCAPLWNRSEVIGVLYCDSSRTKQFREDDLEVFTALCNYAAVAIEQARLSQQLLDETRRRERLQRYHSPGVVNRILHADEPGEERFLAQVRDVTVMFCDIVGFTKMCEHLEPTAVGELLNDYFGRMCEVIFEHEGTLDKFIGDAIMAVFGAPFDQPDHAERCVSAALEMRRELHRVNAERTGTPIRMRIAVNSGRALTGDIGSPRRREFTVLGDVVNTASRLESAVAQPDQIVISGTTRALLGGAFAVRSLGAVTPRGREAQVDVFEVLD